jgi:hypothetical protein
VRRRVEKECVVTEAEKVYLQFGELMFVAFLRFFAIRDQFAHRARMISIERFDDGHSDGIGRGEADEHADPGTGLQDDPVSADRENQQRCNDDVVEPWFQPSSIA